MHVFRIACLQFNRHNRTFWLKLIFRQHRSREKPWHIPLVRQQQYPYPSATEHLEVLENPDLISQAVLARRLDSQTAFEIVSIDIADIDVGENIGARLKADQAEADTRVARAKAE